MAQRGQVGHDLTTALDVVQHHAGETRELPAHQHDGALGGDLVEVLVAQTARREHEAVDGR